MTEQERQCHTETLRHVATVQRFMLEFLREFSERAQSHDSSKFAEPEFSIFAEVTPKLKGLTYGSDEYHEQLKELQEALDHHYAHNSHHPEHHEDGVNDMTLFDVCEMFCDWMAAVERHDDGDIFRSIEINEERFGIAPQLSAIFRNTVEAML